MKKFQIILLKQTVDTYSDYVHIDNLELLLNTLPQKVNSKYNCELQIHTISETFVENSDFSLLANFLENRQKENINNDLNEHDRIFIIDTISHLTDFFPQDKILNVLHSYKSFFDFSYIAAINDSNSIYDDSILLDFKTTAFKNHHLILLPFDKKEEIRLESFIVCNINSAKNIYNNNNSKIVSYNLLNFKDNIEQIKFYDKLFDSIKDSVVITEADPINLPGPRIVYVNKAFSDMTGYSAKEVIGLSPRKLQGPLSNRVELDRIRKALEKWESIEVELINYKKNGTPFWVNFIIIPLANESGYYTHWISIQRETTKRKVTDELIKSSEEQFRLLFDNVLNGMIVQDPMGNILLANNFAHNFFGEQINLLKGDNQNELIIDILDIPIKSGEYPVNLVKQNKEKINSFKLGFKQFNGTFSDKFSDKISDNLSNNYTESATNKYITKWISLSSMPLINANDEIQYIITSFEDITEEKNVRAELNKLSLVASKTINAVIITDENGLIDWTNDGFTRITGYSFEEVKGKKPGTLLQGKETNKETVNIIRENLKKLEPFTTEILNYSKNGRTYWVKLDISPIFDVNGKLINYIAIETDITESKLYEKKLMSALDIAEEFRKLFNITTDLVSILDFDMKVIKFNPAWVNILGYNEDEIYSNELIQFIHKDDRNIYNDIANKLLSGITDINNIETRFITKNRGLLWFSSNIKVDYQSKHLYSVTRNITKQKEIEIYIRKANNELQNYKNALDASALISITDVFGNIQFANEKFIETSQYSIVELIGQNHRIVKSGFHDQAFFKDMWGTIKRGNFWRGEIKNKAKDGTYYWVDTVINPIKNENDEIVQFLAIRYLITERKKVEYELLIAKEEAERANTAKSEFLANMSHEIRTPMNAILGFSELIKKFLEDKLAVEYLNGIVSSGKNLLSLINDILDLSKIESGKIEIKLEAINIRNLINEVRQIFFYSSKQKELNLSFEVDENIPELLFIDETRFRQVLLNLVGNAIKFTNSGYVKVRLYSESNITNNLEYVDFIDYTDFNDYNNYEFIDLILTVEDTGIGIPKDQQEKIFEAFVQREGQSNRKYGGTGLGLTITKRLIEIMKGKINLESEINVGSKFIITLPKIQIEKSLFRKQDGFDVDVKNIKFKNQKVLIVEDIATNRTIINGYLSPHNLVVIEASNGLEALELFETDKPDLIIMDIQMPQLNGYQTIQKIRDLETEVSQVPIIIISANSNIDYEKNELFNVKTTFIKPVFKLDLINEICKHLEFINQNNNKNDDLDNFHNSNFGNNFNSSYGNSFGHNLENVLERIKLEINNDYRLEITKNFYYNWVQVTNTMLVNEIIDFANDIIEYGNLNNLTIIVDLGTKIKEEAELFKIDNLSVSLKLFENIFINN